MQLNLGIIAGKGDLPLEIANLHQSAGGKCFIAGIDKNTDFGNFAHEHFSLGEVGSVVEYFQKNSVKNIVIVGGIDRPDLKSLKVDLAGSMLMAKVLKNKLLGDDNVLRVIASYLESKDFKVISPLDILKNSKQNLDLKTKNQASGQEEADIAIGAKVSKALGDLDVGQAVIVEDGYVIGIEAAEGTDNLIRRCEYLRKKEKGGVLVKMSKSAQDMRLDVPVIGPETVFFLAKHGFSGVAVEKDGVIIVKPEETKKSLDDNGLFLKLV